MNRRDPRSFAYVRKREEKLRRAETINKQTIVEATKKLSDTDLTKNLNQALLKEVLTAARNDYVGERSYLNGATWRLRQNHAETRLKGFETVLTRQDALAQLLSFLRGSGGDDLNSLKYKIASQLLETKAISDITAKFMINLFADKLAEIISASYKTTFTQTAESDLEHTAMPRFT